MYTRYNKIQCSFRMPSVFSPVSLLVQVAGYILTHVTLGQGCRCLLTRVTVAPGCLLTHVTAGPGCLLTDVTVGQGCLLTRVTVGTGCMLTRVTVGPGCLCLLTRVTVGPGCRVSFDPYHTKKK